LGGPRTEEAKSHPHRSGDAISSDPFFDYLFDFYHPGSGPSRGVTIVDFGLRIVDWKKQNSEFRSQEPEEKNHILRLFS
jgi:hypothetical protein